MGKGNQVPVSPRIEHRANEVVQDIGVVRCAENVRGARISQVRPDAQARSYASVRLATAPFKLSPVDKGVVLLIYEYPRLTSITGASPAGAGCCAEAWRAENKR